MPDTKTMRRLLSVLRLGSSSQIHEADAALTKGVSIMEEHGITIDALLDGIGTGDLPQAVCAELARRYCNSRPDMTSSAREDYYRSVFLRIAEKYAPAAPRRPDPAQAPTQSQPKPKQAEEPQSPKSQGDRARGDWKSRMDDTRQASTGTRQASAGKRRQARAEKSGGDWTRAHEEPPRESGRSSPSARPSMAWMDSPFLADAAGNPVHTIRLFLVCCLYSLPRAFISCILIAGGVSQLGIHTFDGLGGIDLLFIAMFPFMVWKGATLYRSGWYS